MKHFVKDQWLAYKNQQITLEEKIEMEEHLYGCDQCMEIFLATIGDEEIKEAEDVIKEDFTQRTMARLEKTRSLSRPRKRREKKVINDYFLYYGAVASVAIILTAGGFFGTMVDSVPKISMKMEKEEIRFKTDTMFNISEALTNKTSDFINNFEIKKTKED